MKPTSERVNEVVERLNDLFKKQGKDMVVSVFFDDVIKINDKNASVLFRIIETEKTVRLKFINETPQ